MKLDARSRAQILRVAKRWLRTPYDYSHADTTWASNSPRAFDCSTFVCRVAIEALGLAPDVLVHDAGWLIDNLVEVAEPASGDVVGYGRQPTPTEDAMGRDALWHVMIYAGRGLVIGACDLAGRVVVRRMEYEEAHGARRWQPVCDPAFRQLQPVGGE